MKRLSFGSQEACCGECCRQSSTSLQILANMTIVTDKERIKNGTDYVFVCGKVPFAVTCSSNLKHGGYNLIDMDLVNKMKIPLQRIQVCRMTYLGVNLRSVGFIDQTVQCVNNGVVQGTVHLSAKVVRNLYESFNVDCIASAKTYERLVGKKPPDPAAEDDDISNQVGGKDDPDWHEVESMSSSSSEEYHVPINKKWLFDASLIAEVAQRDPSDVLLELENEKSIPKQDDSTSDNRDEKADSTSDNRDEENDSIANNRNDDEEDSTTNLPDEEDVSKAIANPAYEEDFAETDDDEDEISEDEKHCNLCFTEGKPIKIVVNHNEGCPTCPTMTPGQKDDMIGPDWRKKAERIFKRRFQSKQDGRRSYARM